MTELLQISPSSYTAAVWYLYQLGYHKRDAKAETTSHWSQYCLTETVGSEDGKRV